MRRGLIRVIESALVYKMDDGGDILAVINCLLEDVRETLKRDPLFSCLTHREFNVLPADQSIPRCLRRDRPTWSPITRRHRSLRHPRWDAPSRSSRRRHHESASQRISATAE
jgi:hypothetical protein